MKALRYIFLGLLLLITLLVFGSDDNAFIVSKSVVREKFGFHALVRIGTELIYKNVSVNVDVGSNNKHIGGSVGIKLYNSEDDSGNRFFGGMGCIYESVSDFANPNANTKADAGAVAVTFGHKYTHKHASSA